MPHMKTFARGFLTGFSVSVMALGTLTTPESVAVMSVLIGSTVGVFAFAHKHP